MEIWKQIEGYNNRYFISNIGRVKSLLSNKEKILSPLKMKHGYIFYRLSIGCKSKTELCHRLVAKYFIDNPNSLPQVDHIDENKANNSVYNLQWITAKDNTSKSQSKKIRQINLVNNDVVEWESISEASRKLGFNKANISKCLTGKKPTMYKSKWEYVY